MRKHRPYIGLREGDEHQEEHGTLEVFLADNIVFNFFYLFTRGRHVAVETDHNRIQVDILVAVPSHS